MGKMSRNEWNGKKQMDIIDIVKPQKRLEYSYVSKSVKGLHKFMSVAVLPNRQ